jgi:PAS domain S-box-containing protein
MSELLTKDTDVFVQMYSHYPFPNRTLRLLDTFQKEAIDFAVKNPSKIYSREDYIMGQKVYRTAFPDLLTAPSCVACHNTRVDTPKNDWKLNEVRGVIEISIPIDSSQSVMNKLAYYIIAFIIFNMALFGIYYYLKTRALKRKLEIEFKSTDKILSEYKRAVDLGSIVSKADSDGNITYVNDSFIEITRYSKEELIGQPHSLVRHPDSPSSMFQDMWLNINQSKVWTGNIKNMKKNGEGYYVHATIVPILDENDKIVEFLAIRYDITSLYEALNLAKVAEKTKGEFLANMSHELRTPLNAIIGFSQLLEMKKDIDSKQKDYISKIKLSGHNLLTLVNTILDFSKIDNNEMEFSPENINIRKVIKEVVVLVEAQASEKSINIITTGFTQDNVIFADEQLLKQAFINIVSNSVKFTPPNGEVIIKYEHENNKENFSFTDNGIGMRNADLENIFKPFKQGSSAKKTSLTGTGLGLSITHKIITEFHAGTIEVSSEENKGTCFTISI